MVGQRGGVPHGRGPAYLRARARALIVLPLLPKAGESLAPGVLYAIDSGDGWICYGQAAPDGTIGFFHHRSHKATAPADLLKRPILARFSVSPPSIDRALHAGVWRRLGGFDVVEDLLEPMAFVQWPVGTLTVTVWGAGDQSWNARVEDPAIQAIELMAVWDAQEHVPARLRVEFGSDPLTSQVGGPIWRERLLREERARQHPDAPWLRLPDDWVKTIPRDQPT